MERSIKQKLKTHVSVNTATMSKPTITHTRFLVTKSQAYAIFKKKQNQCVNNIFSTLDELYLAGMEAQ